jgi:hypothetical protein
MRVVYLTIVVLGLTACSSGKTSDRRSGDTLSERQRDTILSQSSIPGASAVGKAMRVADSTSAEIRATDSIGQ